MIKLTNNQKKVLAFLLTLHNSKTAQPYTTLAEIARNVGGRTATGNIKRSTWAIPICLRLADVGLIRRHDVKYGIVVDNLETILKILK